MTTVETSIPTICNHPEWGFVCGRISVLEGRLLPKEFFLSLQAQQHLDDLLQHLQDTILHDYLVPGSPWEDFSALTDRCFYDLTVSIRDESPSPVPADLFLSQGDYLNLKNALSGMDDFPFFPGEVPLEKIKAIAAGELIELPPVFREIAPGEGNDALEFDKTVADIVVDGAYLRHLLALGDTLDSALIRMSVGHRVLAYAVSVLWRALRHNRSLKLYRRYLLPLGDYSSVLTDLTNMGNIETWPSLIGGKVGDSLAETFHGEQGAQLSRFELLNANHVLTMVQDGRMQTAGPERVFAFLTMLHAEMQNLKLIVTGRLNKIDPGLLGERLREIND